MEIVYISNYFNHHQSTLSDEFFKVTGGNYYFVETTPIPDFRLKLGYRKIDRPYVLKYRDNISFIDKLILEADVVIHGEAPVSLIKNRVLLGKLTFHDNERRYKSWIKYLKWPIYTYNSLTLNKCYLLCASAFAARDFALSGMNPKKCFKWGYFPQVECLDIRVADCISAIQESITHIMWCARFIEWKHPELPIKLAQKLKRDGFVFVIDMYGGGEEVEQIKSLSKSLGVDDVVRFHGSKQNDEILREMRRHDIFLFTSDQNEGWGAVLNEAMWSRCAVVASHAIGAVPYLIEDGKNGLVFKSEDVDSLYEKTTKLLTNISYRDSLRREAYDTVRDMWSARNACRNFLLLCDVLMKGKDNPILEGPCSAAPIMNHTDVKYLKNV